MEKYKTDALKRQGFSALPQGAYNDVASCWIMCNYAHGSNELNNKRLTEGEAKLLDKVVQCIQGNTNYIIVRYHEQREHFKISCFNSVLHMRNNQGNVYITDLKTVVML